MRHLKTFKNPLSSAYRTHNIKPNQKGFVLLFFFILIINYKPKPFNKRHVYYTKHPYIIFGRIHFIYVRNHTKCINFKFYNSLFCYYPRVDPSIKIIYIHIKYIKSKRPFEFKRVVWTARTPTKKLLCAYGLT